MNALLEYLTTNEKAFTVMGILLTLVISIISLRFSVKNNKAVHYVNSVTKNRVDWIDKLRKNIAEFISLLDTQDLTDTYIDIDDFVKYPFGKNLSRLNQVGAEIKLMLNYTDEYDRKIMNKIDLIIVNYKKIYVKIQRNILENKKEDMLIFAPNNEVIDDQRTIDAMSMDLLSDMQIYLKSEWNRVKYESKGKTYEKETQIFDLEELIEKKSNVNYKNNTWKRFCINTKAKAKRIWSSHQCSVTIIIIAAIILFLNLPTAVKGIINLFSK